MIYLVHGPDIVSSRAFLLKLKSQYDSFETIDSKDFEKEQKLLLESQNLFEQKRLLVIENFLPTADKRFQPYEGLDIVIWVDDLVAKPPSWINKAIPFKLIDQVSNFKLADAIGYGQEKQALIVLEKLLLTNTPSELITGALTRQLRLLALGLRNEWDKVSTSPFLQDKIREQVQFWNKQKLKKAALQVLKADWDIKTGNLEKTKSLTLLVVRLCELARA
jgi:DNA polymerase III delta subunit